MFRGFSQSGDDEEVQSAFAARADRVAEQSARLEGRLRETRGEFPAENSLPGLITESFARWPHSNVPDERLMQNVILAYALEMAECAIYEALIGAADAAGDTETARIAREIQATEMGAAGEFLHFLPSRSKIAFNMLTVTEVDPAVETRTLENRVLQ